MALEKVDGSNVAWVLSKVVAVSQVELSLEGSSDAQLAMPAHLTMNRGRMALQQA